MSSVTSNLPRLISALVEYQRVSKKTFGDIIANEAKWFAVGLYDQFRKLSPKPARIWDDAQHRGYHVSRKGNSLTPAGAGLSDAAIAKAVHFLAGKPSDWFLIQDLPNGNKKVKRARVSGRGRKTKLLIGGRHGNKFAPSSKSLASLDSVHRSAVLSENPDAKRLNLHALAVAFELQFRAKAAAGGTLATQWLPNQFKRRGKLAKVGALEVRNPANALLGRVEFHTDTAGNPESVLLSGMVPGTEKQMSAHNILERVESLRVQDRLNYILPRLSKAAFRSFSKVR